VKRSWLIWASTLLLVLLLPVKARTQWENPNRAFHKATAFPLDGRHLAVPCQSCHLNGVYKGTPTGCYDCHWIRRQDDRYKTQLGIQCRLCHQTSGWTPARWDHAAQTGVPLSPIHRTLGCVSCHQNGTFQAASTACVSCHLKDYQVTTRPNHAAAGFPTNCDACHRPADVTWERSAFDHQAFFPLVGRHATVDCQSCHRNNVYQGTPHDCVGCHRADYDRTQNPNHAAAGFSTGCETCHKPTDPRWTGGTTGFNHNSVFPLVGQHATQTCATCHKNSVYQGTPRDCVGCHRTEYDRTQNPNHAAAGFPTTCDGCHKATDPTWSSGTGFNHASVFPLQGVHATQSCATCHKNNVYRGTPRDCAGCHLANYNRTQNPNHVAAGFPTTCDSCHRASDASWNQGTFVHTWFPITSGAHRGNPCSACHTNTGSYAAFTCVTCHDRTSTDSHHRGVGAYRYDSAACYACHPNGRGGN
jgi:hypothetical protein